jgi:tetratricopeptide (TPR) repeat protein
VRYVFTSTAVLGLLLGIIAHPARAQRSSAPNIDALIQSLGDSDSQKREAAHTAIVKLGAAARPALLAATRSNDPAIAVEASRALLELPWSMPDDPEEVKLILGDYGSRLIPGRIESIERLASLPDGKGRPVMLRLLLEEPSAGICWQIVKILSGDRDPSFLKLVREFNPPADDRSPANMLVGVAWEGEDRAKMLDYLNRAVEIEAKNPTMDDGLLDDAFNTLADDAVGQRDYDRAAHIRRIEAGRAGMTVDASPDGVFQLFLLHARYGPLKGFDEDVQAYRSYLGNAEVLYCLSRVYARTGRTIESMACETAARSANLSSASHILTAMIFSPTGWAGPMRHELYASLDASFVSMHDEIGPTDALLQKISARRLLASIATEEGDDTSAIEHLNETIALLNQIGLPITITGRDGGPEQLTTENLRAEIAWRRARLAKARSDSAAVTKDLDEVMGSAPLDADTVQNVYPLLKAAGRDADAKTIFDPAFEEGLARLETNRNDPVDLNDLAWLCARCDQKLPQALEWSTRAVALQPDNAAFIDTLAEVNFRLGHAEEAVKLETHALEMRPEDAFMSGQVEKFRAGIKKPQ